MIIFLLIGIFAFGVGFLSVFSSKFDQLLHNYFGDSKLDKVLFSERDRYVIRRYVSGFGLMTGGVAAVFFYFIADKNTISSLDPYSFAEPILIIAVAVIAVSVFHYFKFK